MNSSDERSKEGRQSHDKNVLYYNRRKIKFLVSCILVTSQINLSVSLKFSTAHWTGLFWLGYVLFLHRTGVSVKSDTSRNEKNEQLPQAEILHVKC